MPSFDPLIFLEIKVSEQHKKRLSGQLLDKLSEYLMIRIIELLPEDEVDKVNSPEQLFTLAKRKIPDIEEKTKLFLEDFKIKYQEGKK